MTKTHVSRHSAGTRHSRRRTSLRERTSRFGLGSRRSDSVQEEEANYHPSVHSVPPVFHACSPHPAAAYPVVPPFASSPPRSNSYGPIPIIPPMPPSPKPYGDGARDRPIYGPSPAHIPTPAAMTAVTPSPRSPIVLPDPEDYVQFYWKTNDLLSELERLQYALRTVGACGPGIQAIDATHKSFETLQWMFGFNTYSLFPRPRDPRFKLLQPDGDRYLADFSLTFDRAADALKLMERAFKDYQSVYYENRTTYLLSCLQKRFRSEAMRASLGKGTYTPTEELKQRIQALLTNFLIKAVEALRRDLSKYSEKGIPVISSAQEAKATRYLNLTTIATFLSAVIAIFLPISAEQPDGALNVGVNTVLFASLTFSIASAVNSLLALTWLKSVVRDPHSYMPFWVTACLNTGPMITLVAAAALFAVGLCLFVFASSQHLATSIVTVSSAGFFTIGLLALAIWLIVEKWYFRRAAGAAGQNLTGTSLSMTVLDWMVLWPQRISEAFTGAEDPSQIEGGRAPGGTSHLLPKSQADVLWDAFADNFLYGTRPSPAYGYGRPGGAQVGSHRPPRSSEAGVHPPHSAGGPIPSTIGGQPSSHEHQGPAGPGYAPTEYGDYHRDDESDYERSDAEPIVIQPPPVDSQTYETALFLPRDEVTGQYEDIHTSSDSDSGESHDSSPSRPFVPPSLLPGLTMPSPMPVHFSENVMVIPTNPPTYVVPPGSYVAYGTQPSIGPSAQAGNYASYIPVQSVQGAHIPPTIQATQMPSPAFIPPRPQVPRPGTVPVPPSQPPYIPQMDPYTPYILPSNLPDPFSGVGYPPGYASTQVAPSRPRSPSAVDTEPPSRQLSMYSDGSKYQYSYPRRSDSRSEPARQDSGLSIISPSGRSDTPVNVPAQSRWSAYYPRGSPYPRVRRRTSTGSAQVRFTQPEVTEPQRRRRSTTEQSATSRPETSASIYSEQLTSEPEEMDAVLEGRDIERARAPSRGRAQPSLDSLQQRHRQSTPTEHPNESVPSSSTSRTTETIVDPELRDDHIRTSKTSSNESSREGRNGGIRQRRNASLPENEGNRHSQDIPVHELSTIDEATESRNEDSDSSGDSVTTAPDTVHQT